MPDRRAAIDQHMPRYRSHRAEDAAGIDEASHPDLVRRRGDGGRIDQRRAELESAGSRFPARARAMGGREQRAETGMHEEVWADSISINDPGGIVEMDVAVEVPDGGGDGPLEAPARLDIFGNDGRTDAEKNDLRHAPVLERIEALRADTRAIVPIVNQDRTPGVAQFLKITMPSGKVQPRSSVPAPTTGTPVALPLSLFLRPCSLRSRPTR
jgi:hypothetical protein